MFRLITPSVDIVQHVLKRTFRTLSKNLITGLLSGLIYVVLFMSKCKAKIFFPGFYTLIGQWSSNLPIEKIQEIKILHFMKTLGPLIFSITLAKKTLFCFSSLACDTVNTLFYFCSTY